MKKLLTWLFVGLSSLILTGCVSTFTPETNGIIAGKLLYTTYSKVETTQDEEFKEKVEKLWTEINKIETTDDLQAKYDELSIQFEDIINSQDLSDADKKILTSVAHDILDKIKTVLDEHVLQGDGLDYLIGVREGVNSMIK